MYGYETEGEEKRDEIGVEGEKEELPKALYSGRCP